MKLYIDPGTGSMLFTILIGIIGTGIYSIRMLWIKLRFGAFTKSKASLTSSFGKFKTDAISSSLKASVLLRSI